MSLYSIPCKIAETSDSGLGSSKGPRLHLATIISPTSHEIDNDDGGLIYEIDLSPQKIAKSKKFKR